MNKRILYLVLGVAAVGGLAFVGWTAVAAPLLDVGKARKELQDKVSADETALTALRAKNARLAQLYDRSLPADAAFAAKEYEDELNHLLGLHGVGLSSVNFSVTAQQVNAKDIPVLSGAGRDQKLAYAKVGFAIKMTGVTLDQLTAFLSRYYALGLLHHITKLDVGRPEPSAIEPDKREIDRRNDLTVNLVTEAVILDGAPARKTLLPVPKANGAVLGGYGLFALEQNPEQGRRITPQQVAAVLATPGRDYHLLAGRDVFHGPLPVPPPPPKDPPGPPPPTPKPDYSEFIKRVWAIRTTDPATGGVTAEVLIYDQANQEDYRIVLTQKGEKLTPEVTKYYYKSGGAKARMGKESVLEISNASMRTKHKFAVYGMDAKGLILGETPTADAEREPTDKDKPGGGGKAPGGGSGKFPGGGGSGKSPSGGGKPGDAAAVNPVSAVVGAVGASAKPPAAAPGGETIYRWEANQSLAQVLRNPLSKSDGEKAVQRAKTGLLDSLPASGPKPDPTPPPPPKPDTSAKPDAPPVTQK